MSGVIKPYTFDDLDMISDPVFSPDGERIAFSAVRESMQDLYSCKKDGTDLRRLTHDRFSDSEPFYSSDGSIFFVSDRPTGLTKDGIDNVFVINDEGEVTPLTAYDSDVKCPVVLSNKNMLYISMRNGINNIYFHEFGKKEAKPLTNLISGVGSYSVSSDGSKLLFSAVDNGGWDIYLLEDFSIISDSLAWTLFRTKKDSIKTPLELLALENNKELSLTYPDDHILFSKRE